LALWASTTRAAQTVTISTSKPALSLSGLFSDIFAFEIDSKCKGGRLALVYMEGGKDPQSKPQIWFQDLSCSWFFIANSFTDYFRLMIVHLGIP
jgi:hypothetical protein